MNLTPESFRNKFMLSNAPYWWAYNARNKKEMVDKFRNDDEQLSGEALLHYSWMQIEEMIESYPFGHIMFVLKTSPSANVDQSPKVYVKWGEDQAIGSSRQKMATQQGAVGGNALLSLMLSMQQENFNQQLSLTRQLIEAQSDNRELEAAIAGSEEPSMKEALFMRGVDVLEKVLTTPKIQAPHGALGTVGQAAAPPQELPPTNKQTAFSLDKALAHINVIKEAIPEAHINDVIEVLAIYVQQNTEQAKALILGLIQQLKSHEG